MKKLLTIKDVSEMLQVTEKTLYRWSTEGKIPFTKLPGGSVRFDGEKLDNWIKNHTARVKN